MLMQSCESKFDSIEQAKNEVNKQGYRDGRWVTFIDAEGKQTENKSSDYSSYMLYEFKDGVLIGEAKLYSKAGKLLQTFTPFDEDSTLYEKTHNYSFKFKSRTLFDSTEKIWCTEQFNLDMSPLVIKEYYTEGEFEGKVKSMINNVYQKSIKTQASTTIYDGDKIKNKFLVEYLNNSIIDFNNKNSSLMKSIEENLNKEVKNNILLKNIIFSKDSPFERPYRINYVVLNSDTFFVAKKIAVEIKKYDELIRKKQAAGVGNLRCALCGVMFEKYYGYVRGLGISCAIKYSIAISNIKTAQSLGYDSDNLNTLRQSYNNGDWLCSKRCVWSAGISECAY